MDRKEKLNKALELAEIKYSIAPHAGLWGIVSVIISDEDLDFTLRVLENN